MYGFDRGHSGWLRRKQASFRPGRYYGAMSYLGLEIAFLSLLVLAGLSIAAVASLVVVRLFKGQK
jgi:hypothetical protein